MKEIFPGDGLVTPMKMIVDEPGYTPIHLCRTLGLGVLFKSRVFRYPDVTLVQLSNMPVNINTFYYRFTISFRKDVFYVVKFEAPLGTTGHPLDRQ